MTSCEQIINLQGMITWILCITPLIYIQIIYNAKDACHNTHKNIMHGTKIDKSKSGSNIIK